MRILQYITQPLEALFCTDLKVTPTTYGAIMDLSPQLNGKYTAK